MINILDKSIYNLISAGEVVEKPASVVKELVENSIDAKATNISIEILNGGINKIKVSDNGCGILQEDMLKAFLPHATSKISSIVDLEKIGTLGFRGEALSSISIVSKTTLISKVKDSELGNKCIVEGGSASEIEPFGCTDGTTMIVENLFYNTPARLKFLRKPKQEETDITNYVARLILANPQISFRYIADGKLIYQSFGNGLYNAIYCVYGKSIENSLIEISAKNDDIELIGYVGKPTFSKPNRTYQSLFVNGRYVINQNVSLAIFKAFENYIMKSTFPFYVLNLKLNLDKVDVNVHPNKLEVKFEKPNEIFGFVYSSVLNAIIKNNEPSTLTLDNETNKVSYSFTNSVVNQSRLQTIEDTIGKSFSFSENNNQAIFANQNSNCESNQTISSENLSSTISYNKKYDEDDIQEVVLSSDNVSRTDINPSGATSKSQYNAEICEADILREMNKMSNIGSVSSINNNSNLSFATDNGLAYDLAKNRLLNDSEQISLYESESNNDLLKLNDNNFKVIGVVFNTFILIEKNENLFFIDQHAAHERILYDKFVEYQKNAHIASQPLLVPYILNVNYMEDEIIKSISEQLNEFGITIEYFGNNSYKISSVPVLFNNLDINKFFNEILKDNLYQKNKINLEKYTKEYIAKTACKNAVKANDKLSDEEITKLFKLFNDETILLCPHGRPIIIKVPKTEIEKWFKRIV